MQNFLGAQVDTASLTPEELKKAEAKIREMHDSLKHQFLLRKLAQHKYSSVDSTSAEI